MTTKMYNKKRMVVPRNILLDAVNFDKMINVYFKKLIDDMESKLPPGKSFKAELMLVKDLVLHLLPLLSAQASFGQKLLNLKYAQDISTKLVAQTAFLKFGLPYLFEKIEVAATNTQLATKITFIHNVVQAANLLNLLVFIRQGVYPTLTERIFGLKQMVAVPPLNRAVDYNFLIRELLYHSFSDLIVFTLSTINWRTVKSLAKSTLSLVQQKKELQQVPTPVLTLDSKCAVCDLRPYTPCRISLYCCHIACYICLQGNLTIDNNFKCPTCDVPNTAVEVLQYIRN